MAPLEPSGAVSCPLRLRREEARGLLSTKGAAVGARGTVGSAPSRNHACAWLAAAKRTAPRTVTRSSTANDAYRLAYGVALCQCVFSWSNGLPELQVCRSAGSQGTCTRGGNNDGGHRQMLELRR